MYNQNLRREKRSMIFWADTQKDKSQKSWETIKRIILSMQTN